VNSIFGITHFGGHDEAETLASLAKAQSVWAQGRVTRWESGSAVLGSVHLQNSPEAYCELLPRWLPEQRLAFTAEARLDNREALCQALGIVAAERVSVPDDELLLNAYLKWGDGCPQHLVGDWSFAAWQPDQKRLFLARDHSGNTALYFYRNPATGCIAFAS